MNTPSKTPETDRHTYYTNDGTAVVMASTCERIELQRNELLEALKAFMPDWSQDDWAWAERNGFQSCGEFLCKDATKARAAIASVEGGGE